VAARLSNLPALYLLGQAATIILAHLATNGHILGVLTGPDSPYGAAGESLPLPSRGVAAAVEYRQGHADNGNEADRWQRRRCRRG
jgi:hypothetical protein